MKNDFLFDFEWLTCGKFPFISTPTIIGQIYLHSLVFEIMRVKAICGRCDKFGNLSLLKRDELTNPLYHYLFLKKIGLVTWWAEFLMF